MTANERKIRADWANFKRENQKKEKIYLKTEDISKIFSKMFG